MNRNAPQQNKLETKAKSPPPKAGLGGGPGWGPAAREGPLVPPRPWHICGVHGGAPRAGGHRSTAGAVPPAGSGLRRPTPAASPPFRKE